jgi:hypothetical protein
MGTEGAPKKKKPRKLPNGGALKRQVKGLYKEFVTPLAYTATTKNPLLGLGVVAGERAVKGLVTWASKKHPKRPKEDKEKNGKKKNYSNKVWKPFGSL